METSNERSFPFVSSKVQISPSSKLLSRTNAVHPRHNSYAGEWFDLLLTLYRTDHDLPSETLRIASPSILLMFAFANLYGMFCPNTRIELLLGVKQQEIRTLKKKFYQVIMGVNRTWSSGRVKTENTPKIPFQLHMWLLKKPWRMDFQIENY